MKEMLSIMIIVGGGLGTLSIITVMVVGFVSSGILNLTAGVDRTRHP